MPGQRGDNTQVAPAVEETIEPLEAAQGQQTNYNNWFQPVIEPGRQYSFAELVQQYRTFVMDRTASTTAWANERYPEATRQIAQPVEQEEETMPLVNAFKVGCDPEFVALDKEGRLINLANYPEFDSDSREIGWDHGGTVAELRPNPHASTFQVVKNLQRLIMNERWKRIPVAKMRAGAMASWTGEHEDEDAATRRAERARAGLYYAPPAPRQRRDHISLGGHVHLDVNPMKEKVLTTEGQQADLDPLDPTQYSYSPYTEEHVLRIRALDHLTHRLEALDILPRQECNLRRTRSGYGRWGEFRVQRDEHARFNNVTGQYEYNKPRMEYRTMASWLFDPKVAFTCLTTAKLATVDPHFALEKLGKVHNWESLKSWIESFKGKDFNATRLMEKVIDKGLKSIQIDPDTDFRGRWEAMAL